MRLADLDGLRVRSIDGKRLGTVREIHVLDGEVVALGCGPRGWIERLTSKGEPGRIPWRAVRRIGRETLVVDLSG